MISPKDHFISIIILLFRSIYNPKISPYNIKKKVIWIINYQPFWDTIKEKEISTYKLIEDYKISKSLIDKLKHNKGINTSTINQLCQILDCEISDIAQYKSDKE